MKNENRILPEMLKEPLWRIRNLLKYIPNRGAGRYCPVCKKSSKRFWKFGIVPREDALCLYCGSLERHRLAWLYLERMTNLFDGYPKHVLHIAPETCFKKPLKRQLGSGYISADIKRGRAMIQMDIAAIQYPNETFDVIYCSHVLEHVSYDKRAIRELYRVLKSDGWAMLVVPITADETFEDPTITDPARRLELFGQMDHVRRYGPDFVKRLKEAGFNVKVVNASDLVQKEEITRMGIAHAVEGMFYCTKKKEIV